MSSFLFWRPSFSFHSTYSAEFWLYLSNLLYSVSHIWATEPFRKSYTLVWWNGLVGFLMQSSFFKTQSGYLTIFQFSSVQSVSHVRLFVTPWTAARQASLSITNFLSLPKLMSIEWVMPSNHLILCHPLLLLPSIFPSIKVFLNESALCIRWPKYWSSSFNISPSNEYSGLISFRIDWLDLLAVQGTLKILIHSSKESILQRSAFFIVQLSHIHIWLLEKP